jgi:CubicO group peptidase (beta-lactamase class C family)
MNLIKSSAFHGYIEELMTEHHVPGLAMAIVHKNKIDSIGFGKACLDPSRPCTAETLFDVASLAKSLTAASIGLLVADDENYPEVRYETVMSSLLPEDFVMPGTGYTEGVTVEDILSHRSGMAGYVPSDYKILQLSSNNSIQA